MLDFTVRKSRTILLTLGSALLIVATLVWHWQSLAASSATSSPPSPAPVPVEVASASPADVPVYLEGLGTVQAFNTVTVKTRVDGQIQKVSFVEGQQVKAGDLLVQIDPRPYQASYDQVVAKKAQDEAQVANAKVDLDRYTALLKTNAINRQQADTQRALVAQLEAAVRADDGAIEAAKVQFDYTSITSPIDGITGIRLVDGQHRARHRHHRYRRGDPTSAGLGCVHLAGGRSPVGLAGDGAGARRGRGAIA